MEPCDYCNNLLSSVHTMSVIHSAAVSVWNWIYKKISSISSGGQWQKRSFLQHWIKIAAFFNQWFNQSINKSCNRLINQSLSQSNIKLPSEELCTQNTQIRLSTNYFFLQGFPLQRKCFKYRTRIHFTASEYLAHHPLLSKDNNMAGQPSLSVNIMIRIFTLWTGTVIFIGLFITCQNSLSKKPLL